MEASLLTGSSDLAEAAGIIESWGSPETMITHADGVLLRAGGRTYYERFSNRSVAGRTGRGDTTFAAYLSWRLDHGVDESLKFAAALVWGLSGARSTRSRSGSANVIRSAGPHNASCQVVVDTA